MAGKKEAPKAPARSGREVVPQRGAQLPAVAGMYAGVGAVGLENTTAQDFAIPFFQILQKLSPQLDRNDPAFIKGAKDGMIINTATQEVFEAFDGDKGEGILFVPCFYKRSYVAWLLREHGGGFRGEYQVGDAIIATTVRDDKGREILADKRTQLVDTRVFAGMHLRDDGGIDQGLVSMSSTQIKKAKRWNTQMQNFMAEEMRQHRTGYPIFAHVFRLTTTGEKNDRGNWAGWVISHEGLLHEVVGEEKATDVFMKAKVFNEQLASGAVSIKHADPEDDTSRASAGQRRGRGGAGEEDIPF